MAKKKIKKTKSKPKKAKVKTKPKTKPKAKSKNGSKKLKGKVKKTVKKTRVKPKAKVKKIVKTKEPKPIGLVTHFFNGIDVAIVRFSVPVVIGTAVHFKGATTDFKETIDSMQYDHAPISTAKKGQEVGIKVRGKVREGDKVHLV